MDVLFAQLSGILIGSRHLNGFRSIGNCIGKSDTAGFYIGYEKIGSDERGERSRRRARLDVQSLYPHLGICATASNSRTIDNSNASLAGIDGILELVNNGRTSSICNCLSNRVNATKANVQDIRLLIRRCNGQRTTPTIRTMGNDYAFVFTHTRRGCGRFLGPSYPASPSLRLRPMMVS